MTKKKSKEIKQLKYLLLIPLLATMVLYTACSENESEYELKKEFTKVYLKIGDKYEEEVIGKNETYMDFYQGTVEPEWEEISYKDLLPEEKIEYDKEKHKLSENERYKKLVEIKIYKKSDGRKVIGNIIDFAKVKKEKHKDVEDLEKYRNNEEDVPFAIIDQAPTFPGCADGDKKCLNLSLTKFVQKNFNADLTKGLGLSPGKKRIYVQFKITKDGTIKDINARAPHPALKEEAIRLAEKLPKMKPGEYKGKKVNVGYTLPITFIVE